MKKYIKIKKCQKTMNSTPLMGMLKLCNYLQTNIDEKEQNLPGKIYN